MNLRHPNHTRIGQVHALVAILAQHAGDFRQFVPQREVEHQVAPRERLLDDLTNGARAWVPWLWDLELARVMLGAARAAGVGLLLPQPKEVGGKRPPGKG